MEHTEQTTDNNIAHNANNIDSSSSTITDTSSHGLPEVSPAPRNSLPRARKSQRQDQEIANLQAQLKAREYAEQDIAALQAQLRAREHELTLTQRQVLEVMTQNISPDTDFPETPPYISFTIDAKD